MPLKDEVLSFTAGRDLDFQRRGSEFVEACLCHLLGSPDCRSHFFSLAVEKPLLEPDIPETVFSGAKPLRVTGKDRGECRQRVTRAQPSRSL